MSYFCNLTNNVMEPETISKNRASLKSHTSRRNLLRKMSFASLVAFIFLSFATGVSAQTSGRLGDNLTWALTGGTLSISGDGAMPASLSAAANLQPWVSVKDRITAVVIEDGVTTIGIGAFEGCSGIKTVTIGKGVTLIRNFAFRNSVLTSLIIPESVAEMETDAFTGANKLEEVIFNAINCAGFDPLLAPPPFMSTKCPALKNVIIGEAVIKIPDYVFMNVTALTSLTIGMGVTEIGKGSFWGCSNLPFIVIPDKVQKIDYRAFYQCTGVTSIALGNELSEIGIAAFAGSKITELTIPENVSKIRHASFGESPRLEKVNFNARSCENVDVDSPFNKSGVLETIIVGDNVRLIPSHFAAGLTGLESVTLGSRINTIGYGAFMGCVALEEIICKAARPVVLVGAGNAIFEKVDKSFCTLRVPSASLSAYKAANIWKDFKIEAQ